MAEATQTKVGYQEYGTPGIETYLGFIRQAYHADLTWPKVQPLYSRLRRSDPEVTIVRNLFVTLARDLKLSWTVPQEYAEDTRYQEAIDFGNSVLDDMEGGQGAFLETLVSHVPFMGWGWWEVVPGLRSPSWTPPGGDPWRSEYSDNRVGIRRLAWRDTSSFERWEIDKQSGRLLGMVQHDFPHVRVTLPLNRSLHITFGDSNNPEGLSPLEAVWRLERIKYGLEVVNGIGFEHSAGFLNVTVTEKLTEADKAEIARAARAIATAQEGNYAAWPKGVTGEMIDTTFSAAPALLEAIRYYGILKLMVFCAQWVAMSTVSGSGSYAAVGDSSEMFTTYFNAMMEGFVNQADRQIGPRLFREYNNFNLEERPRLSVSKIEKGVALSEMSQFLTVFSTLTEFTEDDLEAIRKRSKFLPEQPTGDIAERPGSQKQEQPEPDTSADTDPVEESEDEGDLSLSHLSHEAAVVNHICPLCGNPQALAYPDHKGLLVCTKCVKTYDPQVE